MTAQEFARAVKPESGPMHTEQATVIPEAPPSAAHSMVFLPDGPVIPVAGAAVEGGQVTILRGGGLTMLGPCPRVGCEVARTVGQTITSDVITVMTWPTIVVDTHTYAVASGGTVTIRHAGVYAVTAWVALSETALGGYVAIVTAGSKPREAHFSVRYNLAGAAATVALKADDTLQVIVGHSLGHDLTATGHLEVWRVGW